jgi:hypothetical protein
MRHLQLHGRDVAARNWYSVIGEFRCPMHVTFKILGALKSLASTSTRRIPLQLQHQRNHGITIALTISRKATDTVALL